jgi:hypothetical protein
VDRIIILCLIFLIPIIICLLFEGLKKYIIPCSFGNHDWEFIYNHVKLKNSFWHSNVYEVQGMCRHCGHMELLEVQIRDKILLKMNIKDGKDFYRDYDWGINIDIYNYKLREENIIKYINDNIDMEQKKAKLIEQYETFDKYCLNKGYISKDIIKECVE